MIWIILNLLILLSLILFVPLEVLIEYQNELSIKIKVLFLNFKIQNKKKKNKNLENKNSKIPGAFKKVFKNKSADQVTKGIGKVFKATKKATKYFFKKIRLKTFYLIIDVGAKDSSAVALRYGQVSSVVYPVCALITSYITPKDYKVVVRSDFINEKISLKLKLDFISNFISILFIMVNLIKNFKTEFEKN